MMKPVRVFDPPPTAAQEAADKQERIDLRVADMLDRAHSAWQANPYQRVSGIKLILCCYEANLDHTPENAALPDPEGLARRPGRLAPPRRLDGCGLCAGSRKPDRHLDLAGAKMKPVLPPVSLFLPVTVPATIPGLLASGVLVIQYREEARVVALLEKTALCARGWHVATYPNTELFLDLHDRLTRAHVYWWILDHPRMTAESAEALAGLLELCATGSDLTVEQQQELQAAVLQLAGVGSDPYPRYLEHATQARKAAGPIRVDPLGEVR